MTLSLLTLLTMSLLPMLAAWPWLHYFGLASASLWERCLSAWCLGHGLLMTLLFLCGLTKLWPIDLHGGLALNALICGCGYELRRHWPIGGLRSPPSHASCSWQLRHLPPALMILSGLAALMWSMAGQQGAGPAWDLWVLKAQLIHDTQSLPWDLWQEGPGRIHLHAEYPVGGNLHLAWLMNAVPSAAIPRLLPWYGLLQGLACLLLLWRMFLRSPQEWRLPGLYMLGVLSLSEAWAVICSQSYIEPLLWLFLLGALPLLRQARESGCVRRLGLGMLLLGCAAMIKQEGQVLWLLVCACLLLWPGRLPRRYCVLAASLSGFIFILPWQLLRWHFGLQAQDFGADFQSASIQGLLQAWADDPALRREMLGASLLLALSCVLCLRCPAGAWGAGWPILLSGAGLAALALLSYGWSIRPLDWHLTALPRVFTTALIVIWAGQGGGRTTGEAG